MSVVNIAVKGSLQDYAKDFEKALARANTRAVRSGAGSFTSRMSAQIKRAFGGNVRLAKTLYRRNTPKSGFSLEAKSVVEPKAILSGGILGRSGEVDLVDLYTTAGTVTARNGMWLAIPTPEAPQRAGRGGKRYLSPSESKLDLVFLQTKDANKAVLVSKARGRARPIVVYILMKQTQRRARLDTTTAMAAASARIPAFFEKNWAAETSALDQKYRRS